MDLSWIWAEAVKKSEWDRQQEDESPVGLLYLRSFPVFLFTEPCCIFTHSSGLSESLLTNFLSKFKHKFNCQKTMSPLNVVHKAGDVKPYLE